MQAATHPRVVPAIERRMAPVPLRIIEPQPLGLVGAGGDQLPAKEQGGPQGVMGLEQEVRVLEPLSEAKKLLAHRPFLRIGATCTIHALEAPQDAEEL